MTAYLDSVAAAKGARAKLVDLTSAYEFNKAGLNKTIERADYIIRIAESGFDADQLVIAQRVVNVKWIGPTGLRRDTNEVHACFNSARQAVREGGAVLLTSYLGVKAYDQFASQAVTCQYGYGPRHGSVWFSIGLQPEYWARAEKPLTEDEILAAVSYLTAVEQAPDRFL